MRTTLDFPLKLTEILDAINAKTTYHFDPNVQIKAICTDSRECMANDLFFAINGKNDSGERYIDNAISKSALIISNQDRNNVFRVRDTSDALLKLAELYKSKTNISKTISVSGSIGKTTTVRFIAKILSSRFSVHSTHGNYNNHLGVPLTVFGTSTTDELLVTELGMNHKDEISRLSKCLKPDVAIITAIGSSHIGNLGSRENIAKAKLEILDGMKGGPILLPFDEPLLANVNGALYVARNSKISDFSLDDRSDGLFDLRSPFGIISGIPFFNTCEHLIVDLAYALSAAKLIGLSDEEIIKGVDLITPTDLRQRFIVLSDFTIFDDSYNASLESVVADLKYMSMTFNTFSAFLGDILELGSMSGSIHEQIGYFAAKSGVSRLYLYGEYAEFTAKGALEGGISRANIFINTNITAPHLSVKEIIDNHIPGEYILFKASRKLRLDKIADMIAQKERRKK